MVIESNRNMPNRRGGRERGNHYRGNEHDDRVPFPQDGTRRVSFKNHGPGGRKKHNNRQRGWDEKLRVFMNEDVDMSSNVRSNDRVNNYHNKHRRDGGPDNKWRRPPPLPESPTYWYKIMLRNSDKYAKDYLLKLLASFIKPLELMPYGYKVFKEECSFAVDNHEVAQALAKADRKITTNDGWRVSIRVRPFTPIIEIDPKLTVVMKAVMASRFNAPMKALDLQKFHSDPQFMNEDLFCPLNRANVMMAVLDIISESIPDLVALDLSNNNLNQIEHMRITIEKCPHLKVLHIGNNKLREVKQLDSLKGLPLEELVLDGNSLCDNYTDQETYIRDIRKRFPKVTKLDAVTLPPPILFDEDEGTLPLSRPSFMASEAGTEMVKQFIQQYYQLYDTEGSREPLHQAYNDAAQFSYDCYVQSGDPNYTGMAQYMGESRNLTRVSHIDKRMRLLRRGKISIIEALNNLPRTRHDPTSFIVDLVVFTPHLIQLNVCGLFTESGKKNHMRYFSRVFIIVPVGGGFCIMNDQLTVLLPTHEQIKRVNKLKAEAAIVAGTSGSSGVMPAPIAPAPLAVAPVPLAVAPVAVPPAAIPVTPPLAQAAPDLATKQQMVTTLAANTGMNLLWSEKCLNETNWNYDQAMFAFTKLHKAGSIPPDAFVK